MPNFVELKISRTTDIQRLKEETGEDDILILRNATVVTFENGTEDDDVILEATVVLKGGVIQDVGSQESVIIPVSSQATTIDVQGGKDGPPSNFCVLNSL